MIDAICWLIAIVAAIEWLKLFVQATIQGGTPIETHHQSSERWPDPIWVPPPHLRGQKDETGKQIAGRW